MHQIVNNVEVYGIKRSFKVSKYPKSTNINKCNEMYTDTIKNLASAPKGSGHDNFLKGIVVQFDLSFTIKAWTEAERYHWFDIVSSQSTMHKIKDMNYDECLCKYVTDITKKELSRLRDVYNNTQKSEDYLTLLYNCPVGLILTAGMTTNYQQLKTIYSQRHTHKLPEWRAFCDWLKTLPYSELIIGDTAERDKRSESNMVGDIPVTSSTTLPHNSINEALGSDPIIGADFLY